MTDHLKVTDIGGLGTLSKTKYPTPDKSAHGKPWVVSGGKAEHVALGGVLSGVCSGYPPWGTGAITSEGHGSIEMLVVIITNSLDVTCTGIAGWFTLGVGAKTVDDGETSSRGG